MRHILPVALLLSACSAGPPPPPAITHVDAPATVTAGQKLTVGISFDDPADRGIDVLRVAFPSLMQTSDHSFSPIFGSGAISLDIALPTSAPRGAFEYDVSVLDQSGTESAIAKEMVTIQ